MERVQRWREPAVMVVVVVLLVRLVLLAAFVLSSARTSGGFPPEAANLAGRQLGDPTPYVVLAALVLACHLRPPTAHARPLAALALAVSGLGLLLGVGLAVYGSRGSAVPLRHLDLADRLADAVVPLLAVLLLGLLATRPREAPAEQPALADHATDPEPEPEPPAPDPALQPTWAPDAASGAAWTTAGDAASGRPASGWGTPAGTGWEAPGTRPAPALEPRPDQGDRAPAPQDADPWTPPRP
jgi:hypothetical protein